MNGGSFTAANGGASFLHALLRREVEIDGEEMPALDAISHIAGLSGGNLAIIPYHYAKTSSVDLLDAAGVSNPEDLTMEELDSFPPESLFHTYTQPQAPSVVLGALEALFFGKPVWPKIVYHRVLSPHGVPSGILMKDAKIRSDVKSKPIVETSMLGPASIHPNWTDVSLNRAIFTELKEVGPSVLKKADDPEFLEAMNLKQLYEGILPDEILPYLPTTIDHFEMDNEYMLSLAEKHSFKMAIPAFGTDTEFHIPLTAKKGGGTYEYDEDGDILADAIDFEGPIVASYDEISLESDPFTLENLLGMGTDVTVLSAENRETIPIPGLAERPIAADIPFSSGSEVMSFTGELLIAWEPLLT